MSTGTQTSTEGSAGSNGHIAGGLLAAHRYLRRGPVNAEGWSQLVAKDRAWERSYRGRWSHDKVVRSTHGVNCTGSCSWQVFVKDGLITWESQAVDYPSIGPDTPEYEPRGCPRGASFSWYTYSPLRLRYPYVRGSLIEMFREARARLGDPVDAWAEIVDDPERSRRYKRQRGKGGFVRASWDEVTELIAAAHVHTIKRHGPDRVVGFSPIPAMSMASYAAGTRFLSLIGGVILSFYDWYADLPPASPQAFGDQTDVPESGDWWNSSYLVIWGTNLPTTRTPDAHFMVESRYRGQKVVVVSPDYAEHTKFADDWLAAEPGSDGALAMAMGHVILKEFYVDRETPYFNDYARRFTDLPLLVTLREREDGYVADRLLRAADLDGAPAELEHADWKTVVLDERTGRPVVPNGSVGHRYAASDEGSWNLKLEGIEPVLTLIDRATERVPVDLPRFDIGEGEGGGIVRRGVPAIRVGGRLVTTVLDLVLAHYGVSRPELPGEWPSGYDDAEAPGTPAWQEPITGVDRRLGGEGGARVRTQRRGDGGALDDLHGCGHEPLVSLRSGVPDVLGAGDVVRLRGSQRRRLGSLRRPGEGPAADGVADDRVRAGLGHDRRATSRGRRSSISRPTSGAMSGSSPSTSPHRSAVAYFNGRHIADVNALGARLGWLPSFPSFDRCTHGDGRPRRRPRGSRRQSSWCGSCARGGCGSRARTRTLCRTIRK